MQDDQIKYMAERFLAWRLPDNFNPDGGISFTPEFNVEYMAALGEPPMRHEPTGTNLFDYTQAVAMVQHMIEGFDLETENKHLRRRIAELERACIKAAAPDFMTAAEKEALQDFLQFLRSSETDAPSADKLARLQRERDQAVEALRFVAKWVERGVYDKTVPAADALKNIAHYPGMPWESGRWDVDHKPYAAQFYKDFPKAAAIEGAEQ